MNLSERTMTDLDRHLYEQFKEINGFTDKDVEALRRYCLSDKGSAPLSTPRRARRS